MTINNPLQEANQESLQGEMESRIRQAVREGMVPMLNTGFKEGTLIHVAKHARVVTLPAPGAVFNVPVDVARDLMRMPFRRGLQMVHGDVPQNFTPPPGYKLVPAGVEQELAPTDAEPEMVTPEERNAFMEDVTAHMEVETSAEPIVPVEDAALDVMELIVEEAEHAEVSKKTRSSKK